MVTQEVREPDQKKGGGSLVLRSHSGLWGPNEGGGESVLLDATSICEDFNIRAAEDGLSRNGRGGKKIQETEIRWNFLLVSSKNKKTASL